MVKYLKVYFINNMQVYLILKKNIYYSLKLLSYLYINYYYSLPNLITLRYYIQPKNSYV